ncbi:MAG: GIY-YIG nuclease family protein [Parcubacteria group bacterium]
MKVTDYKKLPDSPGVYLMKNRSGEPIYIGKAGNLKRRVSSYFLVPHDARISKMVSEIRTIDFIKTANALEALVLEAKLIKEKNPPYNVREKDDKSFLYIEITKEKFPRVLLVRGRSHSSGERFGPFTSSGSAREAMKILRRIFPWSIHPESKIGQFKKPCFDYEIGLCPGTCVGLISRTDYLKNIRGLKMFLEGRHKRVLQNLKKEMQSASKKLNFEEAEKIKRRIFALNHVQDAALLGEPEISGEEKGRIEGYDVSDISGDSAVGAMVVFTGGIPDPNEYRKFKIRLFNSPNDTGMMKEMISRRLKNPWVLPSIILVDGGIAQINAAKEALSENGLKIPVIGMVKGKDRKGTKIVGEYQGTDKKILERVRNEAHRFAIGYHRSVRGIKSLK